MMFFEMPLPTWKQIFSRNKQRANKMYYEELGSEVLFFSESYMSISLIIQAIKETGNKEQILVLAPDSFSNEADSLFQDKRVKTVYYPVCSDLNPDWDYIKDWTKENAFDVFIFTHYFGKFFGSISRAKEICKNRGTVLIEDCSHVLYPTGKMGKSGDFVIFDPHKQLPVMDGEVLVYNKDSQKKIADEVFVCIQRLYNGLQEESGSVAWCIEKSLQKIIPLRRKRSMYSFKSYENDSKRCCKAKKISRASYNTLCDYTYLDLKRFAYIRRDNLDMMNYIMSILFPEASPLLGREVDVPYVAAYSFRNMENKRKITNDLINAGFRLLSWPHCSFSTKGDEGCDLDETIFEDILIVPIHQKITPQKLVNRFLRDQKNGSIT